MGQTTTAKPSPITTTTLTATTEQGKDGKLKYLLRQDLFVPPSLSNPNCGHQNIGPVHTVLVIQQFCKYWISLSLCWKSSSFQLPRWTQPGQAHIRKSRSCFIKYWSSPSLPSLPLLSSPVGYTLSWLHTLLTRHPDVCLEGKDHANKDIYSIDTQQLSTVESVVASQVNCPFPCFLYLDGKSSGNRSTAAPSPTPQGTLSFCRVTIRSNNFMAISGTGSLSTSLFLGLSHPKSHLVSL